MASSTNGGKSSSKKKGTTQPNDEEEQHSRLLQKATELNDEIDNETQLEKQFQRQSELLKQYWEIEKKTRDEKRHCLLQKEHRLREIKDKHTSQLGNFKQTIKELLLLNENELSKQSTELLNNYQSSLNQQENKVANLTKELHYVSALLNETITAHEGLKKSLYHNHCNQLKELREEASHQIASLAAYSSNQLRFVRDEYDKRLKMEVKALDVNNDDIINNLLEKNREEELKLRERYNMTINDNLDMIIELKNDVAELREQDRHERVILNELQNKNNGIVVPLEKNQRDLHELDANVKKIYKQRKDLDAQKQKLRCAVEELKEIEWNHEVLLQKYEALQLKRNESKKRMQDSNYATQQRSNFQNLILERKLSDLSILCERNTAVLVEVLSKADISLDSLDHSKVVIKDVISEKNRQIESLKEQLKSLKVAHSTMLKRHRDLLEKHGSTSTRKSKTSNRRSISMKV